MSDPGIEAAEALLHETFGFAEFRPGQREVVVRLLTGAHTLAVLPTGAGKSLCYQIPAMLNTRPTIVVSPLVALMDDQVAGLRAYGVEAAAIHSGRTRGDNVADWRRVQSGEAKLLYLSPERLMTEQMLAALARLDPAMFVVDEAHCISKWGVSFRPEYETLTALKDRFPDAVLAGFTATADAATRKDIVAKLFGGAGDTVLLGFDRPNLRLAVEPRDNWRRQLLDFLENRRGEAGIVYCLSRKSTDEVAGFLKEQGVAALPYHAGMDAADRRAHQELFMADQAQVMVATVAFGMGIDKPDIRYVFHLNMPGSIEAYYQEIGRAGRDGAPAEAFMLFGLDDIRMRRQFIEQEGEDTDHKIREHKRLDAFLAYCEATQCRRMNLLGYFGEDASPCGNCDICLDPPRMIDGTEQARMLFSAIARTGQRFGAAHVIDVLRGSESEKILSRGHDKLPTFGAGKGRPKGYWQAFVRQAVAGGCLAIDIERMGGLRLTAKGEAVLQGEDSFEFREIPESAMREKVPRKRTAVAEASLSEDQARLLRELKALRLELAKERGVPAFAVFPDATLHEMCRERPGNLEAFRELNGVGPKKLAEFGEVFLTAIRAAA